MALVLQGLVIKDLTTGQMYGLDKTSSDACGESSTHLTDIAGVRKITLDEFSGVLGNDSTFTVAPPCCAAMMRQPHLEL